MRHKSDFILLHGTPFGDQRLFCDKNNIPWPPPLFLSVAGWGVFRMTNMSQITDEQIQSMTHVARGAEYVSCSSAELPGPAAIVDLDTQFAFGDKDSNNAHGQTDPGQRDGHSTQIGGGTDMTRYTRQGM